MNPYNMFLFYYFIFIQYIRFYFCKEYTVSDVDPPHIKIEKQTTGESTYISLIFEESFEENVKISKILYLENEDGQKIECNAADEIYQDKDSKNKIIFKLEHDQFLNFEKNFGKYKLTRLNSDSIKFGEETILILLYYINFKNPIKAYVLTNGNQAKIKYKLSNEIEKDYINRITYIDDLNPNSEIVLSDSKYKVEDDKKTLMVQFDGSNRPKNITFYIYPEYDKKASRNEVQKVYLYFQDFILLNDAIYIKRKNNKNSLVYFRVEYKEQSIINKFSINVNSGENRLNCANLICNNLICNCSFSLGFKENPGKIEIEHISRSSSESSVTQKREIFLILYETTIQKCYKKAQNVDLDLTTYFIEEMEYEDTLYFNDSARKSLTKFGRPSVGNIKVNKYTAKSSSLNSGTFCIYSLIPDLVTDYNSITKYNYIDEFSLYLTIYPGKNIEEDKTSTIYTNNETDQFIEINSTNAGALDEIILKKINNELKIKVSLTNGECSLTGNTTFKCNLNKIHDYGKEYEGNYNVFYRSPCDTDELLIEGRIIIIKRGISLLSLSPSLIYEDESLGKNIILIYNENLNGKTLAITVIDKEKQLVCFNNNPTINGEYVIIPICKNLTHNTYYINTRIDGTYLHNNNIGFKVIHQIKEFKFSHHYFVLKNNATINRLVITVDDNSDTFGCMIEEANRNINLTTEGDCKTFYYNIDREGQINFNYYYKDSEEKMVFPIDDNIIVGQTYDSFFEFFSLKNCYYYKFDINIKFYNALPEYFVFLYNEYKTISLIPIDTTGLYIKYYINENYDSYSDLINNRYYLIISEAYIDSNIYLYKSNELVSFTNIEVPEFIINPNKTITFKQINCNLDKSKIEIKKKNDNLISKTLSNCIFNLNNRILTCEILSNYFYTNNPFVNYIYTIESKIITNINDENTNQLTFASNKISDSSFDFNIKTTDDFKNIMIEIINNNCDFYSKLYYEIGYFLLKNGKNDTTCKKLYSSDFIFNDKRCSINFNLSNGNYDYDINYIKRQTYPWEGDMGDSIYHYFSNNKHIINNTIFIIEPTLFAYYDYSSQKDSFQVNVTVKHASYLFLFVNNLKNLKIYNISNLTFVCFVDTSSTDFKQNKAQTFSIFIGDNEAYLDFIYYSLDSDSKKCKTKNNEKMDLTLVIDIPDKKYSNIIKLESESSLNLGEPKISYNQMQLNYTINGKEINLIAPNFNILILGYPNFKGNFSLTKLGFDFVPEYEMRLINNEKKISFLPENGQYLIVNIYTQEDLNINLNDIKIVGINDKKITDPDIERNNKDNSLNITLNLLNFNSIGKDFKLFYIDRCDNIIYTDIIITVIPFSVERKYFVLKNNYNMKGQRLIIKGPHTENTKLYAYKDNSENSIQVKYNSSSDYYYLDFDIDQTAKGEYTFKIFNNGFEFSKINEKVYVFYNLEELFKNDNVPNCRFLDDNKKYLNDIIYSIEITPDSRSKVSNINDFQSKFLSGKSSFSFDPENINNDKRRFKLEISNNKNNIKETISRDKEMCIYLTEKNFDDQPIYVFKFYYTNITLNAKFSEVIYTDALYILFDMSCLIDDITDNFILSSSNNQVKNTLKCTDYSSASYNAINKVFTCNLFDNDKSNILMQYGKNIFTYGYYNIYYNEDYLTNKKPFYLSHEIETADFIIFREKQIDMNAYTYVNVTTPKKIFYLPNIQRVNYNDTTSSNNPINVEFKITPQNSNWKNITFGIFIENRNQYTINTICRIDCDYCGKGQCWRNDSDYFIYSNTKDITFKFNRKYISLYNSTDLSGNRNIELNIEIGGKDYEKLVKIIAIYTPLDKDESKEEIYTKNNPIKIPNPKVGKYEFKYRAQEPGEQEEEFTIKNTVLLVANYDYEIFNLKEISKNCIYYHEINDKIFTSITPNSSYKFKNSVYQNDLVITINKIVFEYNENYYIKYKADSLATNNIYKDLLIQEKENQSLIFTNISHQFKLTDFEIGSSSPFYYKDNIVITNQFCILDNIYIRESDSEGRYYSLVCDNNDSNLKSYCQVNFTFSQKKSNIFRFFIGENHLYLDKEKEIYNSINDSNFYLSYVYPDVTITSDNFEMKNISYLEINHNILVNSFIGKNSDLIQFKFELSNDTLSKNYVTNLIRNDHPEDRSNTIKNKVVNLEIIEKECEVLFVRYLSFCITCKSFSEILGNENRIWYQEGTPSSCELKCDFENGYGIFSQVNHHCKKCEGEITPLEEGGFACGCLEGTVKSFEDDNCYLPESDHIKKLLIQKKNAQCYLGDGKTKTYCDNKNTEDCKPYSVSGYFFPQCICKEGFTGKYCEYNNNNITLAQKMKTILSNDEEIDEKNIVTISNIRGVIFFLEKDGTQYIQSIISYADDYIQKSINNLQRIVEKGKTTSSQIFDVLELALYFLKYLINNSQSPRNLQEEAKIQNYKKNLTYILNNLHLAHYYGNKNMTQDYNIQTDGLGLASFITYKKDTVDSEDFKYEMANTTQFRIMEYIDLNPSINSSENINIFVTLINNTLFDESEEKNDLGVKAYFSTKNSINLQNIYNFIFYISSSDIHFNFNLAQYYQDRKINIYNKKDNAFVDPCFLSKNFAFDLTQKYRKNNVFQKRYYGSDLCEYISFDSNLNRLKFACSQFEDFGNIEEMNYAILSINIQKDSIPNSNKVYNLPTKCTKKIDNVGSNIAFWLFLIICSLELVYIIGINILTFGSLKKISFRKGLVHDELYIHIPRNENPLDEDTNSNNMKMNRYTEKNNERDIKTSVYQIVEYKDIGKDKYNKNLVDCILINFKELHPVAALCRVSIISPLILHSWFFVFNTLILFGFNALLYYENLIEKRIYDKKRNYFDYPMRKEFHKIILSILCQVAITILIKLLLLVKLSQRNDLKMNLTKCILKGNEEINNDIVVKVEQFQDQMFLRRIIGGAIMLCGVVFFFYYSVAFCGVYINTQKNWFYSGIWSLFWNWIIFAPIYIVVISFIENSKQDSYNPLVYNLKRLYCF